MMDPIVYGWIGRGRVAITGAITVDGTYRGLTIDVTSGTFSIAFLAAATLGSGYHVAIYNSGSGTVTLDPAGTETMLFPSGSATTQRLNQYQGCVLACTGTGWEAIAVAGLSVATAVTGSGTLNRLAMFTATGSTIGDSTIANGSITGVLTFSKTGTTARTHTFQDLAGTVAALEATQTFTGADLFNGGLVGSPSPAIGTATNGFYAPASNQIGVAISGTLRFQFEGTRLTISSNATTIASLPGSLPSNTLFRIAGIDGGTTRVVYDSWGAGNLRQVFRKAEGTAASPSALTSGAFIRQDSLIGFGATVYGAETAFQTIATTEAWTDSVQGFRQDFHVTPNGAVASIVKMRLGNDGGVQIRTSVSSTDAGSGQLVARAMGTDQQNVSTTGNIVSMASDTGFIRMTGAAPVIQGILAPTLGTRILRVWVTTTLTVNHQDAAAANAAKVITSTGAPVVVGAGLFARFTYDTSVSRWLLEA